MYSNMAVSNFAMLANSLRMRIIAENIANSNTTSLIPGGEPYRRKVLTFRNEYEKQLNATVLKVESMTYDRAPFKVVYNPNHPAANDKGYVLRPNVDLTIETADMRESLYTYNANMAALNMSRTMFNSALSILK